MSKTHRSFACLLALTLALLLPAAAHAVSGNHLSDGAFTSFLPTEWTTSTVSKTYFPIVGNTGGAYLYVQQGDDISTFANQLYLMYDYVNSTTGDSNTFFDIFFQVPADGHDYLVRIHTNGTLDTFEKPIDTVSNILPSGSFDTGSPWSALDSDDLTLARFDGGIGTGTSPDSSTPHLIVEFEVSIKIPAGYPDSDFPGLYQPEAAFWSASKGNSSSGDPPISSAIFQLNPDGTVTVTPAFGPDDAPVQQPQDLPEPASFVLLALGGLMLVSRGRRIG